MAAEWVARLTAVGVEMVAIGLGGVWLDDKLCAKNFCVKPLFALAGFAIGIGIGVFHLLLMTAPSRKKPSQPPNSTVLTDDRRPNDFY